MSLPPGGPDLASLSSLDDPVRRRLYGVVIGQPGPVGRDEAAAAAGIGRALAVYHLDKLVESGLLTASYQRPPGRNGPGAGRPAKLYSRSDREFAVTVPPREYELAARLLVRVVEDDPSGRSRAALGEAARRLGTELGRAGHGAARDAAGDVNSVLAQQGYEPCRGGDGVIRLRSLGSASTAWTSSRAASSYSRGGTVTVNSRSDREYSLAGRPAPGPLRPAGRW